MLYVKLKKIIIFALVAFLASSILFATNSYAALFEDLTSKGAEIFKGMREIIYAVAGFGIVAIAIGGFFGNFNWKWLGAIIIGLMVIALTAGIWCFVVTAFCCIFGMYVEGDPASTALNVITPFVLTALGLILPIIKKNEKAAG